MKTTVLIALFYLLSNNCLVAQQAQFNIHTIRLPQEIAWYDNQFSGLSVHDSKLFLLSESRLQENAEAKLYTIALADIEKQLSDSAYTVPWKKFHIYNLDSLKEKIDAGGPVYEGLEAMILDQDAVYFSVETATPALNCYLLKGVLTDSSIVLNTNFLVPVPKFTRADGTHIYNAGFEAMAKMKDDIFAIYEYNYFPGTNKTYVLDKFSFKGNSCLHTFPIPALPFRLTDITYTGENHFTAVNYFYKGGGEDTVYRTPAADTASNLLITEKGGYKNYSRLVDLELKDDAFAWKTIWEFPAAYADYNWEGIAAYNDGYFIMNDKYSPKPYRTVLLYLELKKQP